MFTRSAALSLLAVLSAVAGFWFYIQVRQIVTAPVITTSVQRHADVAAALR